MKKDNVEVGKEIMNTAISLLPVVSKVLEKLVYNRIVDFISSSISSSQYGFLRTLL